MQSKLSLTVFLLFFGITMFLSEGCKSDNNVTELEEAKLNDTLLLEITADSNAVIEPTNSEEKKVDTDKQKKLKIDLEKSEYSECEDILKDYANRIEEFKSGNRKPLKEFKIQDDPMIKLCKKRHSEFANEFKTLQDEAKLVVEAYLKSLD